MKIDIKYVLISLAAVAFIVYTYSKRPLVVKNTIEPVLPTVELDDDNYNYRLDKYIGMASDKLNEPDFPSTSYLDFNDPAQYVPEWSEFNQNG